MKLGKFVSVERLVWSIITMTAGLCLSFVTCTSAQDGVPQEILERTVFIRSGSGSGTAFKIEHEGKIYLVTARHVLAGAPTCRATIQILAGDQWTDFKTKRTLFPPSSDVDIAVLETEERVSKP